MKAINRLTLTNKQFTLYLAPVITIIIFDTHLSGFLPFNSPENQELVVISMKLLVLLKFVLYTLV